MLQTGRINFSSVVDEGHREFIRESVKREDTDRQKLDALVQRSKVPLIKISSSAFSLTRSTLVIEVDKISVVEKEFLASERIISLDIKEIGETSVATTPFFATLNIVRVRTYPEEIIEIRFLKKSEATRARRIIQGLIEAEKKGIDVTKFDPSDLINKIEELGTVHQVE